MPQPIIVAKLHTLYDISKVEQAMRSGGNTSHELTAFYEKMLANGGTRSVVSPSGVNCIDDIDVRCPNFKEVSEFVREAIVLSIDGEEAVSFTPLLLLGEPGIGKTHFAMLLANHLGTSFEFISMGFMTAGWVLGGASVQWKNAQPGKVARKLIEGEMANPVMVIDEIDKASGDERYDPFGALHSLFESDTAKAFRDEYVDVPLDAGPVLWVCTANDDSRIPRPILDRMEVFSIRTPTYEETAGIVPFLYQEMLKSHRWNFVEMPASNVIERLAHLRPRSMKRALRRAFGRAKLADRDYLVPEDIRPSESGKVRIGF